MPNSYLFQWKDLEEVSKIVFLIGFIAFLTSFTTYDVRFPFTKSLVKVNKSEGYWGFG